MGRPKQDLNKWCNTNVNFKFEFLDHECKKNDGLVQCLSDSAGYIFVGELKYFNQPTPQNVMLSFQQAILENGLLVNVSLECFNKLKKQFIKYKKEKTKSHLVKKQYQFTKDLSARIQYLKDVNGWRKEEFVIEYLVNVYLNQETQYKTKVEIETKPIKFTMLKDEISKNLSEIQQLKTKVFQLKQQLQKETVAKEYYQNFCKELSIKDSNA